MNEVLVLAPALAAGLLLGAFFFGGLWWTVIKGVSSPRPALWFFTSMLLRMSVTLAGFYFVGREDDDASGQEGGAVDVATGAVQEPADDRAELPAPAGSTGYIYAAEFAGGSSAADHA